MTYGLYLVSGGAAELQDTYPDEEAAQAEGRRLLRRWYEDGDGDGDEPWYQTAPVDGGREGHDVPSPRLAGW